jgi:hypothetical protein
LGVGDPERKDRCGSHWVVDLVDRSHGPLDAIEFIGLVGDLVVLADSAIERYRELEARPDQCSRR